MFSLWQVFLHFSVASLTNGCLELQLRDVRNDFGGVDHLMEIVSGDVLSFDVNKPLAILLQTSAARTYRENVQVDRYKLLGSESRRFYIIHLYDRRFDAEKGYSVPYSRGQLTTSLYSDTLKPTPSLTQPLKTVSTCDDNVFELIKTDPQWSSFVAPFKLVKHYDGAVQKVLCVVGNRFLRLRLLPLGVCSRYSLWWT